jgi:hypothetical protein
MRRAVAALLLVSFPAACSTTTAPPATRRTTPEQLAARELPPSPDAEAIPPEHDWAVAVQGVQVAPGDRRDGILLSFEKAQRAARLRIAYDELRALYSIDLRTWAREREVYERYLQLADDEIGAWRLRAQRSWWEENGDEFGLFLGLGLGIVLSVAVGAIIVQLEP